MSEPKRLVTFNGVLVALGITAFATGVCLTKGLAAAFLFVGVVILAVVAVRFVADEMP